MRRAYLEADFALPHPGMDDIGEILTEMVGKIANYHYKGLPESHLFNYDDLYQSGMLVALKALPRYDPSKGVSLKTFLWKRIKGGMQDLMREVDYVKRTDREKIRKLKNKFEATMRDWKCHVPISFVATSMGTDYENCLGLLSDPTNSLEDKRFNGSDGKLLDIIQSDEKDPFDIVADQTRNEKLLTLIKRMDARKRLILGLYYKEELTLIEIGNILNISEGRVSQIKTETINELREKLKGY